VTDKQVVPKPEPRLPAPVPATVRDLLEMPEYRRRFEQVLGDPVKAAQFISSLATLVYAKPALRECDPNTVIAAALQAAALDLPIQANLGFAAIVPYKRQAQFQPQWKGIVQLCLRTGQYAALEVNHAFEGEIEIVNRFTGQYQFNPAKSGKVVGVVAYMKLVSGFEKFEYWTLERIHAHAKRYSKGYDKPDGGWTTAREAMELKTVLASMLRKWGIMSVEMRQIITPPEEWEPEPDAGGNGFEPQEHATIEQDLAQAEPSAPPPPSNAELDSEVLKADARKVANAKTKKALEQADKF